MSLATFFSRPFSAFRATWVGASSAEPAGSVAPVLDYPDAPPDIRKLIRNRQYGLIVHPKDGVKYDSASLRYAFKAIEHDMAYVPGGTVTLWGEYATTSEEGFVLVPQTIGNSETESVYLDRWCVTNADYRLFIQAGGYEDLSLWPEHVLPSVLQFVDKTGRSGPATWEDGDAPRGREAHPVVGISWYEANAYAQWAGKRLPTGAEWQRAATWGKAGCESLEESKYPWGNSFDPSLANTWASGKHGPVAIDQFLGGDTPNGIRQMIGNVWEWTNTQYLLAATEEIRVHLTDPMAEIRGGAYDSYFHTHATCQSRSAHVLSNRAINVGFRCCFSAEDLDPVGS